MKKTFVVIFGILVLIIYVYILNKTANNDSNKIINTENIETIDFEQYISSQIMIAEFNYLVGKIHKYILIRNKILKEVGIRL